MGIHPARQAKQLLRKAIFHVEEVNTLTDDEEGQMMDSGLPPAFPIVASHMHNVKAPLSLWQEKMSQDGGDVNYESVLDTANKTSKLAEQLERLFSAVLTDHGKLDKRLAAYRKTVKKGDGKGVEKIMEELLNGLVTECTVALRGEECFKDLQAALEEVKKLPPSVSEAKREGHDFNHYGDGNQFNHTGTGHQNANFGSGPQMNGDDGNVTIHHGMTNSRL